MKHLLSILTFTFLLVVLSCCEVGEQDISEPIVPLPPPDMQYTNPLGPNGTTPFPTTLKITNSVNLIADLKTAVNTIRNDPDRYWTTVNGVRYTDFSGTWPTQAKYIKRVHFIEPPDDFVPLSEDEFKAFVYAEIPKLGLSTRFTSYI